MTVGFHAQVIFLLGLAMSACSFAQDTPVPWGAPASVSVVTEEKTFENGPIKLSGTLYLLQRYDGVLESLRAEYEDASAEGINLPSYDKLVAR